MTRGAGVEHGVDARLGILMEENPGGRGFKSHRPHIPIKTTRLYFAVACKTVGLYSYLWAYLVQIRMIKSVTLIAVVTLTLLVLTSQAASADPGEVLITSNYPVTLVYEGLPQRIPLKAAEGATVCAPPVQYVDVDTRLRFVGWNWTIRDPCITLKGIKALVAVYRAEYLVVIDSELEMLKRSLWVEEGNGSGARRTPAALRVRRGKAPFRPLERRREPLQRLQQNLRLEASADRGSLR